MALVGRPNVGKSTLLNQLLGQKIAATTHKPQTTRRNLMGVLHPRGAQILLLDTPGHHSARGPLNRFMVGQVRTALRDADVLGYVVEAREDGNVTPGNEGILEEVVKSGKPVVLIINKIDRVNDKERLLLQMQTFRERLQAQLQDIVPISATRRDGLEQTVIALGRALPEGEPLYDGELITDASERAIVAELIREKVMLETRQELPYAAAITIDAFEDDRPRIVRVMASLHVERSSQKAIVIGKGGERLKAIGQRARFEMENFLGSKVFLDLHVRTTERWTERPEKMAGLGYEEDAG